MGGRLGTALLGALLCVQAGACGRTGLYLANEDGGAGPSGSGGATAGTPGVGGLAGGAAGGVSASGQGGGMAGGGMAGTWTMLGPRPQPEGTCAAPEDDSRFANGKTMYVGMTPDCEGHVRCYTTIQKAVNDAENGDTILLLPGTYDGAQITQSGEIGDLRITSRDGPGTTFVRGIGIRGPLKNPGEIWVDHLAFRDAGSVSFGWGINIESGGGAQVRIQDNVFDHAGEFGAVVAQNTQLAPENGFVLVIARNRMLNHQNDSGAVLVSTTTPKVCARIENNLIANNRVGIFYDKAEVVNNTITGNQALGSMLPTEGGVVANNIFFANETPEFSDELAVGGSFVSNLVDTGEFTGLHDNFSADPLFVDAAHGDYHLRDRSAAAAAGDEYYAPLHDIDNATRTGFIRGLGAFAADPIPAPAPEGVICGDHAVEYGPVSTAYGTYVGFETCEETRGLSCSKPCQQRPSTSSGSISMLGKRLCALRMDGSISCWNVPLPTPALTGPFWQVAVSNAHVCALLRPAPAAERAAVRCWLDDGSTFDPPGTFSQIVGDYSVTCGVRSGGFTCWDETDVTLDVDGDFYRVDVNRRICALSPDGYPTCWDGTAQKHVEPPAGPFIQMVPSSATICGLKSSGELACPPSKKGFDVAPRAGFIHVDGESYATVGLRPDGRVLEWEVSWAKLPETDHPFYDIVASSDFGCGLTGDHRVSCWKDDNTLPHE